MRDAQVSKLSFVPPKSHANYKNPPLLIFSPIFFFFLNLLLNLNPSAWAIFCKVKEDIIKHPLQRKGGTKEREKKKLRNTAVGSPGALFTEGFLSHAMKISNRQPIIE